MQAARRTSVLVVLRLRVHMIQDHLHIAGHSFERARTSASIVRCRQLLLRTRSAKRYDNCHRMVGIPVRTITQPTKSYKCC